MGGGLPEDPWGEGNPLAAHLDETAMLSAQLAEITSTS